MYFVYQKDTKEMSEENIIHKVDDIHQRFWHVDGLKVHQQGELNGFLNGLGALSR